MRAAQKGHRQKGRIAEAPGKNQIGFGKGPGGASDKVPLWRHHFAGECVISALSSRAIPLRTADFDRHLITRITALQHHRFTRDRFP